MVCALGNVPSVPRSPRSLSPGLLSPGLCPQVSQVFRSLSPGLRVCPQVFCPQVFVCPQVFPGLCPQVWYGHAGYSGDGGPGAASLLNYPQGIALDSSGNLYISDDNNIVIRKVAQATVLPSETPVITPGSSSILAATTVSIASPVGGATIYYTTNGTTPSTSSPKYTGPFTVSKSETVEAFSTISGSPNTAAAVANYLYVTAPTATTQAAAAITASGATLNGTVTANNGGTDYWFAYGTSQSALTKSTTQMGALGGTTATAVSAGLTGLTTKTTYFFQVVAQNPVGTTKGKVMSFTTK